MDILAALKRFQLRFVASISSGFQGLREATTSSSPGTAMQGEEQYILAEVKRRKERALKSGVVANAFNLYQRDLPYYDSWARNCPHLLHPGIKVANKTRTSAQNESVERIEATIRASKYVFTFRQKTMSMPDRELTYGFLDVDFQGQRVMTIDCTCEDDQYAGRIWRPSDVSAFIEGPWVDELNVIFAEVARLHDEDSKRKQDRAKKAELEKLKKGFGL